MAEAVLMLVTALAYLAWYALVARLQQAFVATTEKLLAALLLGTVQIAITVVILEQVFSRSSAQALIGLNLAVSTLVVCASVARAGRTDPARCGTGSGREPLVAVLAVLGLLAIARTVTYAVVLTPYAYDDLCCLLAPAAQAAATASMRDVPTPDPFVEAYPRNISALFAWTMILPGNDRAVLFVQFAFALGLALAVSRLCAALGLSISARWVSFLAAFLTPIVLVQSTTGYVDVATSSLLVVAIYYLVSASAPGDRAGRLSTGRSWVMFFLAAGMHLGTKYTAVPQVVLLVLLAVVFMFRRLESRVAWQLAGVGALCLLILGGHWYLRNLVVHGNPLYPWRLPLLGDRFPHSIGLEGALDKNLPDELRGLGAFGRLASVWFEASGPRTLYVFDSRMGGLGPQWIVLFLPAIFFMSWLVACVKRHRQSVGFAWTMLAGLAFVFFVASPGNWWTRYVIFLVAPGVVAFAFLREHLLRPWVRRAVDAVLAVCLGFSLFHTSAQGFWTWPALRQMMRGEESAVSLLHGPVYGFLRSLDGVVIGHGWMHGAEAFFIYPLYGKHLNNRVVHLVSPNPDRWLDELRRQKVDYVLTSSPSDEILVKLARDGPERIVPVFAERGFRVVKVEREP